VRASVHRRLISRNVKSGLDVKNNALKACESYGVYQTLVGKAEDGVDALHSRNVEQILGIRPQVNEFVQDTKKAFDRGKVEVDGHLLVLLRGVERFVYDTLLSMTNIL
jgi:hypothetical protein